VVSNGEEQHTIRLDAVRDAVGITANEMTMDAERL
jgi:hypothetical protein